jgi:hypothetical protein
MAVFQRARAQQQPANGYAQQGQLITAQNRQAGVVGRARQEHPAAQLVAQCEQGRAQ